MGGRKTTDLRVLDSIDLFPMKKGFAEFFFKVLLLSFENQCQHTPNQTICNVNIYIYIEPTCFYNESKKKWAYASKIIKNQTSA